MKSDMSGTQVRDFSLSEDGVIIHYVMQLEEEKGWCLCNTWQKLLVNCIFVFMVGSNLSKI